MPLCSNATLLELERGSSGVPRGSRLNSFTAPLATVLAFLNMNVVSTNFAKMLVSKRENDVIL